MITNEKEKEIKLLKREYEVLQNNLLGLSNNFEYDFQNLNYGNTGVKKSQNFIYNF